jgi:aldose 1-epimerase
MTESLWLEARDARVELAPAVGGAIARFTLGDADVLRPVSADARAAANVRGYACYPLVPYSNRIANAQLEFGDLTHPIARNFGDHPHSIHGLGWQRAWSVAALAAQSALIVLEHTAEGSAASAWPWPFRASQSFALDAGDGDATLIAKIAVENTGKTPFPFGLGFHPFFPRTAATELGFHAEAIWETDATQLPTLRVPVANGRRFDPPRAIGDPALDNVFTDWTGAATLVDRARHLAVTIEADRSARFLVVYVPPGRGFLALEPVTHMTDAFNRAARGEADTGTRILGAGAGFSCTMRICAKTLR